MIRLGVLGVAAAAGILAGPATSAQPVGDVVPVARAVREAPVALAGDRLLLGRQSRGGVRILSAPIAGGKAVSLFSVFAALRRRPLLSDLDASSQRAAFIVLVSDGGDRVVRSSVWAGPPAGPFVPVVRSGRPSWLPVDVQVSGTTVGITEIHPTREAFRHSVFPAGAPGVPVPAPPGVDRFELAGRLVAFVEDDRRLVVRDWASGVERLRHAAGAPVASLDLADDGRVLLHLHSKGVVELLEPSGAIRRLDVGRPHPHTHMRLAGAQAVLRTRGLFKGDAHIAVIDLATGQRRRLSPPSYDLELAEAPLAVQGGLVAWWANGCAFAAPVAAPGSRVVPPGPCPRAEMYLEYRQPKRLQGRTARVRFRCVTAPPPGCRGIVRLQLDRPLGKSRYLIPAGRSGTVRVRLTSRGLQALRQESQLPPAGDGVLVGVRATLIEGVRPRSATPHQGIVLRPGRGMTEQLAASLAIRATAGRPSRGALKQRSRPSFISSRPRGALPFLLASSSR